MEENKQLIKYKKSFFEKLKEGILKIFSRKEKRQNSKVENISSTQKEETKEDFNSSCDSKQEFMEIYQKVKNGEIDLDTLDDDILYKVMTLLNEEIDIMDKKIEEETKKTENILNNANIYVKELEMLNKKS